MATRAASVQDGAFFAGPESSGRRAGTARL
jgi:hypothetical protein